MQSNNTKQHEGEQGYPHRTSPSTQNELNQTLRLENQQTEGEIQS
jgi:hypothetical protein